MQIVQEEMQDVLQEQEPKWAKEYDEKMASGKWAGSWEGTSVDSPAWGRKERSPEYKKQKDSKI